MPTPIDSETCQACGECCRHFPFVEMSQAEIGALAAHMGMPPDAFTYPKDERGEEHFLQFRENGSCIFLIEDRGRYSCGAHEARPGPCRTYPVSASQHERCDANQKLSLLPQSQRLSRARCAE